MLQCNTNVYYTQANFWRDYQGDGRILLYASNNEGGFIIGHDGNNEPAINTAARFNPETGNGIVMLETGHLLLATEIAGEWVFWETGNVDLRTLMMSAPMVFRTVAYGCVPTPEPRIERIS